MSESVAGTAPETESVDEQPFAVERELTAREAAVAALEVVARGMLGAGLVLALCALLGFVLCLVGLGTSELGAALLVLALAGAASFVASAVVDLGAKRLGRGDR